MKYKLGDEVYLKGVITSINSCAEIKYLYEVKTADEFVTAAEQHLEPINKEEAPLYLRNVLARLRELPEHDRKVWMDEIMHEFANDYGSVKYTLGYEQGKFDGAVEAEKSNKVVIPQFVAKWLEDCKEKKQSLYSALQDCDSVNNWLDIEGNEELFARAWLDGYDVEQEKRYAVMLCNGQSLKAVYRQGGDYLDFEMVYGNLENFTKQQLEDAGFGWVFDCEGVEVQEVE